MRTHDGQRMFTLKDLNELFRTTPDPIILNKINFTDVDYTTVLRDRLYSQASDINFIATCECGHLNGNFFEGVTCPKCRHKATRGMDAASGTLPHTTWLSFPKYIPGVLHPRVYIVLSKWLTFSNKKINYLDAILDPKMELPPDIADVITGRGYTYLYNNYDLLMDFFLHQFKKSATKPKTPLIEIFIQKYRHITFCNYLPILSKALHPIIGEVPDSTGKKPRQSVDPSATYVLEAANRLSFLEFTPRRSKSTIVDNIIHEAYKSYIFYIEKEIGKKKLGHKKALPRQHIFGARFHWSFRSVIVPITGAHRYDELHLPYNIATNLLKIHIIGRLMQRHNMDVGEAASIQLRAVTKYDPYIHEMINEFIRESPGGKGLPILFNRNPTLKRGSIQKLYFTLAKPDDDSIGMSVLTVSDCNADFDGDALAGVLILENRAADVYEALHPSQRYLDPNSPSVGSSITLPGASLLCWNNFLGQV